MHKNIEKENFSNFQEVVKRTSKFTAASMTKNRIKYLDEFRCVPREFMRPILFDSICGCICSRTYTQKKGSRDMSKLREIFRSVFKWMNICGLALYVWMLNKINWRFVCLFTQTVNHLHILDYSFRWREMVFFA